MPFEWSRLAVTLAAAMTPSRKAKRRGSRRKATGNGDVTAAPKSNQWAVAFYKTKSGEVPARDFLVDSPDSARQMLLAIVVAVRDGPPPSFPPSKLWHVMKREMKGFHEARDEHGDELHRLFCILDRNAPEYGLDAPTLVLVSGGHKRPRTAMKPAVYKQALAYKADYLATNPRRILLPAGIPAELLRKT